MTFNWKEYLEIAKFLKNINDSLSEKNAKFSTEAAYRVAISRAYYAAFCYARNHAKDKFKISNQH